MKAKLICALCMAGILFASCNLGKNKKEAPLNDLSFEEKQQQLNVEDENQKQIPLSNSNQHSTTDSAGVAPAAPVSKQPASNPDWDKKIIKTGNLKVEVKDFKSYSEKVHQTVKQLGGYIAQEEQSLTDEKAENIITIKVPVAQFEDMLNQLPGNDSKVIERKITSEDVTGEVVDTKSRLETKKQVRLKYLEFLKQSKNTDEVFKVQNEINNMQEEIEAAAGRIGYLSNQSAYSTVHLIYFQPSAGYTPSDTAPSFGTRTATAFKNGASWIVELFIGLLSIWPLLLVITVVIFIWRKTKAGKVAV